MIAPKIIFAAFIEFVFWVYSPHRLAARARCRIRGGENMPCQLNRYSQYIMRQAPLSLGWPPGRGRAGDGEAIVCAKIQYRFW